MILKSPQNQLTIWVAFPLIPRVYIDPMMRQYRQISNISRKYQNLNISRLVLRLSLPNPLMPGVKSRKNI